MEKIILVIVDNVPTLNIAVRKEETIGTLKELLRNSVKDYNSYKIEMFLNPTAELKVWDTNMYDNLTLQSVWNSMENSSLVLTKSSSNKTLTGIKDVDLLILSQMDDKTLYNFCKVNKSARKICSDENFWKNRFIKKYGMDAVKYKPKNKSWKEHYSFVHYMIFETDYQANYGHVIKISNKLGKPQFQTVPENRVRVIGKDGNIWFRTLWKISYPSGMQNYTNVDKIIFAVDGLSEGRDIYSIGSVEETRIILADILKKNINMTGIIVLRIDDENDVSMSERLLCKIEYCDDKYQLTKKILRI